MQSRGNSKRHTVASTEEVHSIQQNQSQSGGVSSGSANSSSSSSSGIRTRRTGLLTVKEKPPGMFDTVFIKYLVFTFIVL